VVSIFAGSALDNLVALIGGFCSVPLAFVYPAACHFKIVGTHPWRDAGLVVFGLGLMIFATTMAILTWTVEETPSCTPIS
jgi:proton-coupled amino acid transporter